MVSAVCDWNFAKPKSIYSKLLFDLVRILTQYILSLLGYLYIILIQERTTYWTVGLCIVSRYIECIDTLVTIWLTINQIKSIDSHDMYQNIFLAT